MVQPLSPPLKSGPTISSNFSTNPSSIINTSLPLVPVSPLSSDSVMAPKDPYKVIPPNPVCEGKQRFQCANCHSDSPSRHYFPQCEKPCQFKECLLKNSLPHWGNTCQVLANHLKTKRANYVLSRQNTSKAIINLNR